MCRSIKVLRDEETTTDDVRAAALQFVRKVSGTRAPSQANLAAFEHAVSDVSVIVERLLDGWVTPPRRTAPTPTASPSASPTTG